MATVLCLSILMGRAQAGELLAEHENQPGRLNWDSESLSLGLSAGWLTGRSHEFVYDGDDKISELIWELDDAFVVGVDLSVPLVPALTLNLRGWIGGHIEAYMEDYDWMALDYGVTDWTHLSQHDDTELDHFARIDASLQYDFLSNNILTIGGLAGLRLTEMQWSAYGGTFVYTSNPGTTFRDDKFTLGDDWLGITYRQTFTTPYLGVVGSLDLGRTKLTGTLLGSPFSYLSTEDEHWLRDLTISADFDPTIFWSAVAEVSYRWSDHWELFLNAAGERYVTAEGDSNYEYYSSEVSFDLEDGARADHHNLQVLFGFRVSN
ncbi:MAG TPA: omptin family outer membrane protease [Aestuariivirgaceae bacterium]